MEFNGIRRGSAAFALTLLAACGGGDGDALATDAAAASSTEAAAAAGRDAADKYVGTWNMRCTRFGSQSEAERFTIAKASAARLSIDFVVTDYPSADCSGTPAEVEQGRAVVTIDGQAQRTFRGASREFDLVTALVDNEGSFKWTATILPNGNLLIDFEDNGLDSSTRYPDNPDEGQSEYVIQ